MFTVHYKMKIAGKTYEANFPTKEYARAFISLWISEYDVPEVSIKDAVGNLIYFDTRD